LQPLIGTITIEAMQQANLLVDREQNKQTPRAAAQWLEQRR
jgi:osmoprotectant transport system permease protein